MKCKLCNEENPEQFYKDKSRSSGFSSRCKACTKETLTSIRTPEFVKLLSERKRYRKILASERVCTSCKTAKNAASCFTHRKYVCDDCAHIGVSKKGMLKCTKCKIVKNKDTDFTNRVSVCNDCSSDKWGKGPHCQMCETPISEKSKSIKSMSKTLCKECESFKWENTSDEEKWKACISNNLKGARHRASIQQVPFSIKLEDFTYETECPVYGIPYTYLGPRDSSPSLDRLVPEKGYVKGNVKIISMKANADKSNMSIEHLEKLLIYIKENT